jgi:hypothetical protein
MSKVSQIQKKVQSILSSELGSVRVDADGSISIPYESTLVTIQVEQFAGNADETVVDVMALISFDTPASSALYKWINEKNSNLKFGTLYHLESAKNRVMVLQYSLLGDFLDPAELLNAVRAVVIVADILDDEVVNEFGGRRFSDK